MRRRLLPDDDEGLFWPGLVDLFAFGMVVMLILGMTAIGLLRGQRSAGDDLKRLESLRVDEVDAIRTDLRNLLGGEWTTSSEEDSARDHIVINLFDGRQIAFASARADLDPDDATRLGSFARGPLDSILVSHRAARIVINGTADWQQLASPVHPRDNTELSALRAASVAKILREASPDLQSRLTVAGLGEIGEKPEPSLPDSVVKQMLQPYRSVSLEIRIATEELLGPNARKKERR